MTYRYGGFRRRVCRRRAPWRIVQVFRYLGTTSFYRTYQPYLTRFCYACPCDLLTASVDERFNLSPSHTRPFAPRHLAVSLPVAPRTVAWRDGEEQPFPIGCGKQLLLRTSASPNLCRRSLRGRSNTHTTYFPQLSYSVGHHHGISIAPDTRNTHHTTSCLFTLCT